MTVKAKNTSQSKKITPSHIYDTFVIGAGISGIAAAIRLEKSRIKQLQSD